MKKKHENPFAWNEAIQELTKIKIEDEPKRELIRIDLTEDEINRLIQGDIIQTQYPWLLIGKKIG